MRKILLFLFAVIFTLPAAADIFTVTSNADSGPGTLRQAMLDAAANGSAVKDYIYFNLPDLSETGRTILVPKPLPDVSSNLEIDGTTQPGVKFGVSDSKVKISVTFFNNNSSLNNNACFSLIQKSDVSFYGLFIERSDAILNPTFDNTSGIYAAGAKNIIIGAPGKGNIIRNCYDNVNFALDWSAPNLFNSFSENVQIQSNFLGINEDGKTVCALKKATILINNVRDFKFGGTTAAEGNVVFGTVLDEGESGSLQLGNHLMSNNKVGVDYWGSDALIGNTDEYASGLEEDSVYAYFQTCEVSFNVCTSGIMIIAPCFFTVKGNKIGTDITGTKIIPHKSMGLIISYCSGGGKVGGTDPADKNIFAGGYQESYFPLDVFGVVGVSSSPKVEVIGNVFTCNNGIQSLKLNGLPNPIPVITNRTATTIFGTAAANARIDLYYSTLCSYCEPQQLFSSVNADATGKWAYNGPVLNYPVIAAATLNGQTSEFTSLKFVNQPTDVKIGAACNGQHGYIKGMLVNNATNYTWYNDANVPVAYTSDLADAVPGKYHLNASDGYCNITSDVYEIKDASNQIDDSQRIIKKSSCGNADGSITNLQAIAGTTFTWTDQTGVTKGTSLNLTNVKAGSYTLLAVTADKACSQTYGPIVIPNATGPNIDQTGAIPVGTACAVSDGSITNVAVTGGTPPYKYSWKNAAGKEVATTLDLTEQPAGVYTLTVSDASTCPPVATAPIPIPEINGIILTDAGTPTQVDCSGNGGGITGIKVTGATTYNWFNAGGALVGTQPDLARVAAGSYYLTASNNTGGCPKTSKTYTVSQQANTDNYGTGTSKNLTPATCGQNNGAIEITLTGNPTAQPVAYRWVNQTTGQTVGTTTVAKLGGLDAGTYDIYVRNSAGCERLLVSYPVFRTSALTADISNVRITDDNCNTHTGSIIGPLASGLTPLVYAWTDDSGNPVGSASTINNLSAGNYHLKITDGAGCELDYSYTLVNKFENLTSPDVKDVQLCGSGNANIRVLNVSPDYTYRLYENMYDTDPIDVQSKGVFKVNVKTNRSYYISKSVGECESGRVEVKVTVGITTSAIANTFSPNGDGVNDTWKIAGIESYPNAQVQIFTRAGQKIFESNGYSVPFDGTYGGKRLPVAAYYYIINLNSGCSLLSGSLTLVR